MSILDIGGRGDKAATLPMAPFCLSSSLLRDLCPQVPSLAHLRLDLMSHCRKYSRSSETTSGMAVEDLFCRYLLKIHFVVLSL